jgi:NADH-quinone oxidoreductase subunit A
MQAYLPVLIMGAFALAIALVVAMAPTLLGPRRATALKCSPYECGLEPVEDVGRRLPVRFCVVAILFMLFDVELAFLFPWAVWWKTVPAVERGLQTAGAAEMAVFLVVLALGYVYVWRRGGLEWD